MIPGCDTNQRITPAWAAGLYAKGKRWVGRYHRRLLTDSTRINLVELQTLHSHRLGAVFVFQHRSNRVEEFTLDNAKRDAEAAIRCSENLAQPKIIPNYLAFDTDFVKANVGVALAYGERWARDVKGAGYGTGPYGDKEVLELLTTTYREGWGDLFDHRWQTNARAWGVTPDYDILQKSLPYTILPGLQVDDCEARGVAEAGIWMPEAAPHA